MLIGAYLEEKQTSRLSLMGGDGGSYSKLPRAWEGGQEVFSQIFAFQRASQLTEKAVLGGGRSTS